MFTPSRTFASSTWIRGYDGTANLSEYERTEEMLKRNEADRISIHDSYKQSRAQMPNSPFIETTLKQADELIRHTDRIVRFAKDITPNTKTDSYIRTKQRNDYLTSPEQQTRSKSNPQQSHNNYQFSSQLNTQFNPSSHCERCSDHWNTVRLRVDELKQSGEQIANTVSSGESNEERDDTIARQIGYLLGKIDQLGQIVQQAQHSL